MLRSSRTLSFAALLLTAAFLFSARTASDGPHPARAAANPLVTAPYELYDFARIDMTSISSAAAITEAKVNELLSVIDRAGQNRTFENTMIPLDELLNTLQKATSLYELLVSTHTDPEIRDVSGELMQKFTTMTDELMQNELLDKAVKTYAATADAKMQTGERAFFLEKMLRQFRLNGMALSLTERDTLKSVNNKLNELSVSFTKNISSDKSTVTFSKAELAGLPQSFLAEHPATGKPGNYTFDLSTPTYTTFMSQCSNTESRKKMYIARMSIGGVANEQLLVQILALRSQKARLLGFRTYSEYATADIMAKNTETVWRFEKGLAADIRPKAQKDLEKLLEMKNKLAPGKEPATVMYPYEAAYYSNELLKREYKVDPEKVKEYFEMGNVINGIFAVYQQLYNLSFVEDKNPSTWHKDVKAYTVIDNATQGRIGYFYLDLYPRADKYNHFACFPLTGSMRFADGTQQLKTAALVCNFPPATADQPSLLPHNTVTTFFHEFGHLIHVILSDTELASLAGTNVPTDFVEAPSQIMENWAWEKSVLSLFAKHYKTGKMIPDTLVNSMIAARNLNSGLQILQQVYYGTLDFTLNDNPPPASGEAIVKTTAELQNSIMLYPYVDGIHFASSFGHLTGYGSRYYGYLWSLVYASDMYSVFSTTSPLSPETGKRYRTEVLSRGGSADALTLVRNFLGREPNNKAFLNQIGLK